jgi:hypothetical protein
MPLHLLHYIQIFEPYPLQSERSEESSTTDDTESLSLVGGVACNLSGGGRCSATSG